MVLPYPETNDFVEFQEGVDNSKKPEQVGEGARLVKTDKVNGIILFESLPNDYFEKWEQVNSPIYCDDGINRHSMECDLIIHF